MQNGNCIRVRAFFAHLADELSFNQFEMLLFPDTGSLKRDAFLSRPSLSRRVQGRWDG